VIGIAKRRLSRLAELLAEPPGAPLARNLRAFRFLLLLHVSVQSWSYVITPIRSAHLEFPYAGSIVVSTLISACALLALTRYGRVAPILALPPLICRLAWSGLWTPNHTVLAFACLLLTATLDPDRDDEGVLLVQGLRWITLVVLFSTGLQKLLHGCWFRGEFLAWMLSKGTDDWRSTFGLLVPASEMERLTALDYRPGSGPYRVDSVPFILLSNFTYLAELLLPVLILLRRTRVAATLFAIGFLLAIQLAPREFMFFLLFTNLVLLFLPCGWSRRLTPLMACGYLYLLAALARPDLFGDFVIKANGRI